jgi:hypothetical protein
MTDSDAMREQYLCKQDEVIIESSPIAAVSFGDIFSKEPFTGD